MTREEWLERGVKRLRPWFEDRGYPVPDMRKRKPLRLGKLRKSVAVNNRIYGLLVQAHDALRGHVIELENRIMELERDAGKRFNRRTGEYEKV